MSMSVPGGLSFGICRATGGTTFVFNGKGTLQPGGNYHNYRQQLLGVYSVLGLMSRTLHALAH